MTGGVLGDGAVIERQMPRTGEHSTSTTILSFVAGDFRIVDDDGRLPFQGQSAAIARGDIVRDGAGDDRRIGGATSEERIRERHSTEACDSNTTRVSASQVVADRTPLNLKRAIAANATRIAPRCVVVDAGILNDEISRTADAAPVKYGLIGEDRSAKDSQCCRTIDRDAAPIGSRAVSEDVRDRKSVV